MEQQHSPDVLDRMETAKAFVAAWYNSHVAKHGGRTEIEAGTDVYVTWFSKTLKNWKAMLSTTVDDGRYYEATFNGDKHELYLDVYRKEDNTTISEELVGKSFDDTGYHTVTKTAGGYSVPAMQVSPKMRGYLDEGLQHRATEKAKDIHDRLAKLAADTRTLTLDESLLESHKHLSSKPAPGGDWDMHPDDVDKDNA